MIKVCSKQKKYQACGQSCVPRPPQHPPDIIKWHSQQYFLLGRNFSVQFCPMSYKIQQESSPNWWHSGHISTDDPHFCKKPALKVPFLKRADLRGFPTKMPATVKNIGQKLQNSGHMLDCNNEWPFKMATHRCRPPKQPQNGTLDRCWIRHGDNEQNMKQMKGIGMEYNIIQLNVCYCNL